MSEISASSSNVSRHSPEATARQSTTAPSSSRSNADVSPHVNPPTLDVDLTLLHLTESAESSHPLRVVTRAIDDSGLQEHKLELGSDSSHTGEKLHAGSEHLGTVRELSDEDHLKVSRASESERRQTLKKLVVTLTSEDARLPRIVDRVPLELWFRIVEMVAFGDFDFIKLATIPTPMRKFFPNIKKLCLVNRIFHNAANRLRDYIATVGFKSDAVQFLKKQQDGITTRLLSFMGEHPSMMKCKVLQAAAGVEHLVVGSMALTTAQLSMTELKGNSRHSFPN